MTHHICDKCNVNNAVILDLQFYTFYNFNSFKYLNTWHCTSQIVVLVCASTPLYLRFPEDGFSVLKHVGFI